MKNRIFECAKIIVGSLLEDDIPGGRAPDSHRWGHLDPEQLAIGKKVEMEHTDDPAVAEEIAADHLTENPNYYRKLKKAGLADELKENEPCPDCAHGTPREQQLAKLGWTCFWGAGVWLNPKSTYQVGVYGIEDYPEDEWQQIIAKTNAERPGAVKSPPKADIMPGGSVGGPAGDSTAIGGGGSAGGV